MKMFKMKRMINMGVTYYAFRAIVHGRVEIKFSVLFNPTRNSENIVVKSVIKKIYEMTFSLVIKGKAVVFFRVCDKANGLLLNYQALNYHVILYTC